MNNKQGHNNQLLRSIIIAALFVICSLFVSAGIGWNHSEPPSIIQIAENSSYSFDWNSTTNEIDVEYSTTAADEGFTLLTLNASSGLMVVTIPERYLNGSTSSVEPAGSIVIVGKNGTSTVSASDGFRFNITNINEPPTINFTSPTQTYNLTEGDSVLIQVSAQDFDPTNDILNMSWFVNYFNRSDFSNFYAVNSSNVTYSPAFNDTGNNTVIVSISDGRGGVTNYTWTMEVINSNFPPELIEKAHFTSNTTKNITAPPTANVSLTIFEGDWLNLSINYTDEDWNFSYNPLELYKANVTWFVDGVDNMTPTIGLNSSSFRFNTANTTVLPANGQNRSFIVTANVTDGWDNVVTSWNITVRNTNVAPLLRNVTVDSITYSNNSIINTSEGSSNFMSIGAFDLDENIQSYQMYLDGQLVASSSTYTQQWNFTDSGLRNFTYQVTDTQSATSIFRLYFNVSNNTEPRITNFTVYNSTQGNLSFAEGDLYNVSFNYTDDQGNIDVFAVLLNGTQVAQSLNYTYNLNFSDRGAYNITVFVNDTGGLSDESSYLFTVDPVLVVPTFVYLNVTNTTVTTDALVTTNISTYDRSTLNISFLGQDLNGNNTIDTYQLLIDGVSPTDYNGTREYLWEINDSQVGIHTINITVNDTDGLSNSSIFTLNVSESPAPFIDIFTIQNSTFGNASYFEGDILNMSFNFTDIDGNVDNYSISIDNETYFTNSLIYNLNYTSRGLKNITAFINDSTLNNDSLTIQVNITAVEVAPVISNPIFFNATGNETVNSTSTVTANENANLIFNFTASDLNGNSTLSNISVLLNGSVLNASSIAYWQTNFQSSGTYNISYFAQDNTGLQTYLNFTLVIANNTVPTITTTSITNSTGGNATFFENDTIQLYFNYSDTESNIDAFYISYDGQTNLTNNWTFRIPFNDNGNRQIQFFVNDTEGLNASTSTTIYINKTFVAPIIENTTVLYSNGTTHNITEFQNIVVDENETLNLSFAYSDPNAENFTTIISRNNNTVATDNSWLWATNFSSSGVYNMSFTVNDSSGLQDAFYFNVTILNNTAPIANLDIYNATNGTFYAENSTLFFSLNVTDPQNQISNFTLTLNDTVLFTNTTVPYVGVLNYTFNLSQRGSYNVSLTVIDLEGLTAINQSIVSVNRTPIAPQLLNVSAQFDNLIVSDPPSGYTANVSEQLTLEVNFSATDVNGLTNIDVLQLTINESVVQEQKFSQNSTLSYSSTYAAAYLGLESIELYVNDSEGLNATLLIYQNISANSAPVITGIIVTNTTGGSAYYEGEQVNIFLNVTDTDNNIDNYTTTLNTTVLGTEQNFTATLPTSSRGNRTLSAEIVDKLNVSDNLTIAIEILPFERAPVISSPRAGSQTPNSTSLYNETFTATEELDLSFIGSDPNGNSTIAQRSISIIGPSSTSTVFAQNTTWEIPSGSAGVQYNISFLIKDTTNLTTTLNFSLIPKAPVIQTQTVQSSGGGGGGGGGSGGGGGGGYITTRVATLNIENLPPIQLTTNETTYVNFTFENNGKQTLNNLTIVADYPDGALNLEILSYNKTIAANSSIQVAVRLANVDYADSFNVTLQASGYSGPSSQATIVDSATLYVNFYSDGEVVSEEFDVLYRVVSKQIKDESKCLELIQMVEDAQKLAEQSKYDEAVELLRLAGDTCLNKGNVEEDLNFEKFVGEDTTNYFGLFITLVLVGMLVALPTVYLLAKKRKKKKSIAPEAQNNVDGFLDDFYK